jgi:hypothetical protein
MKSLKLPIKAEKNFPVNNIFPVPLPRESRKNRCGTAVSCWMPSVKAKVRILKGYGTPPLAQKRTSRRGPLTSKPADSGATSSGLDNLHAGGAANQAEIRVNKAKHISIAVLQQGFAASIPHIPSVSVVGTLRLKSCAGIDAIPRFGANVRPVQSYTFTCRGGPIRTGRKNTAAPLVHSSDRAINLPMLEMPG